MRQRGIPVIATGLFLLAMTQFLSAIGEREFHRDEARWIHRAEYLRELGHPFGNYWQPITWANGVSLDERHRLEAQPPMGSYLMGIGFVLQGESIPAIGYWNMDYDTEWNAAQGNLPSDDQLITARRTTATLGALAVVMVFLIGTRLTTLSGAVLGATYLAIHPLARYLSTFAGSDAALAFFIAATVLVTIRLSEKPTWWRAVTVGILIGFGASTKLSPFGIAIALAAWGAFLVVTELIRRRSTHKLGLHLLSTPIVAVATFVLSYPYLWRNPVARSIAILRYRTDGMEVQGELWQQVRVDSPAEAMERIWHRFTGAEWSVLGRTFDVASPIEIILAIIGAAILVFLAAKRGTNSATTMATISLAAMVTITIVGMKVDWARYHFPILLAMSMCIGVTMGWIHMAAARLIRSRHH